MGKSTFEAELQRLIDRYPAGVPPEGEESNNFKGLVYRYLAGAPPEGEESNKDSGEALLTLIVEEGRLRRGVTEPGEDRDRVDAKTIAALQNPSKLGPEHSIAEAAFRRLVPNPEAAAGYVDAYDTERRSKQSRRARRERPRGRDSITRKIDKIVSKETSKLPAKVVGLKLAEDADIEFIGDEYRHKDGSTLQSRNLDSRVWDAWNRISKRILG